MFGLQLNLSYHGFPIFRKPMGETLKKVVRNLLLCSALVFSGCNHAPHRPLEVVSHVDLFRYVGHWYEIAHFPNWFLKGCFASTATYRLREDGLIEVLNQCRKDASGEIESAKGKAWVVDSATNAKLKVRFFWPFSGDYWIIDLGPAYEYAVVGHPSRDYLWILSRTPQMSDALYQRILEKLRGMEYDVGRLVKTRQTM